MKWLRRIAAGLRALLTVERKIEKLRWRRVQHGQDPHTDETD